MILSGRDAANSPYRNLLTGAYFAQCLTLVSGVLLAHALAPSGRGELALWLAAVSIAASVVNSGVVEYSTYHFSHGNRFAEFVSFRGAACWIVALVAAIVVVTHLQSVSPWWISGGYLTVNAMTGLALAILLSQKKTASYAIVRIVNILILVALFAVLVFVADVTTPEVVARSYLVSEVGTASLAWALATRSRAEAGSKRQARVGTLRRSALWPAVAVASISTSYDKVGILLIALLYSDEAGGYVVVALSTMAPITVAATALVPWQLVDKGTVRDASRSRWIWVAGCGVIVYMALAPLLIPTVFGKDYSPAVWFAYAIALGTVSLGWGRIISAQLRGRGGFSASLRIETAALAGLALVLWTFSQLDLGPKTATLAAWGAAGVLLLGLARLTSIRLRPKLSASVP